MQRVTRDGVRDHFTAEVITEDTLRYLKYYFRLTDTAGKIYFQNAWETSENEPEDGFYEFLYANETNVLKVPEWAKGVIYYQISRNALLMGILLMILLAVRNGNNT